MTTLARIFVNPVSARMIMRYYRPHNIIGSTRRELLGPISVLLMHTWKKILRLIDSGLLTYTLLFKLRRVGLTIEPYILYVEPNRQYGNQVSESEWLVEQVRIESLQEIADQFAEPRRIWLATWRRRLESGEFGLIIRRQNEVIGFSWADLSICRGPGSTELFRFAEHEACLHDIVVSERFRGAGLAVRLRNAMNSSLAKLQRTDLYSVCAFFNTPARKFKDKVDAKTLELRCTIKIFNIISKDIRLRRYQNGSRAKKIVRHVD